MPRLLSAGFLVAAFLLTACSESSAPTETSAQTEAAAPAQANIPQGVIPQAQLDAMAKAGNVSNVLEQAEQERRKQMEAQGL
ncbi:MAG: hypothetical protein V4628_09540 [Pseudomonadota bacterium]